MALRITDELQRRIREHGVRAYPHECCGALLGRDTNDAREVLSVLPLDNRNDESPRIRFAITADDVRRAEATAREHKLELVGWYHSHPDHPARPSEYDREHALPWYSYIILGVERGAPGALACWRLRDDRTGFEPERVEVVAPTTA